MTVDGARQEDLFGWRAYLVATEEDELPAECRQLTGEA
jgi:hypothetical protein